MLKKIFVVLLSLSLIQCRSSPTFEQRLSQKNCEAALTEMPANQPGYKLISKSQEVSGTVLSYAAVGSAYTVQLLWDVTATVGAVVILCSPTFAIGFAAAASSGGSGSVHPMCFPGDISKVQAPMLGKNASKQTEKWNCPDVDGISQSIRKVAQCYSDRGDEQNRKKALASLQSVEKSGSFYRCLSNTERDLFISELKAISGSLSLK